MRRSRRLRMAMRFAEGDTPPQLRWERWALASTEAVEECRRVVGDARDLVRGLAVKLEIELCFGTAVAPFREGLQLVPPKAALRARRALDPDAHAGRLPRAPAVLRDCFGAGDDPARDQALPALVLAREHKDRVAACDLFAAIHRLLCNETERVRPRIGHFGLDRKRHSPSLRTFCRPRDVLESAC